jgi:hypothetical protein
VHTLFEGLDAVNPAIDALFVLVALAIAAGTFSRRSASTEAR